MYYQMHDLHCRGIASLASRVTPVTQKCLQLFKCPNRFTDCTHIPKPAGCGVLPSALQLPPPARTCAPPLPPSPPPFALHSALLDIC